MSDNPETVTPRLVIITSYMWVYEAHLAKALLESYDIEAFVSDDNIVTVDPLASVAYGGVKVMVSEDEAVRALEILRNHESGQGAENSQDSEKPETESDGHSPHPAEDLARRAYVAAVFGIAFIPLQLYSLWLLVRFYPQRSRASRSARRKAIGALLFNSLLVLWGWMFLGSDIGQ